MKTKNNEVLNSFIINVTLIDPIKDILKKLEEGNFRDCDISWLDNKLSKFVEFTTATLNIKGVMPQRESVKPKYMNSYAVKYYSKYFNQLLEYFKSF